MRSRLVNALLFLALGVAAALSAAPQAHEWLHDLGNHSNHECAATLLSSGGVEHSDGAPPSTAPNSAPSAPAFRGQLLPRVLASLEFTRLEHAPPFFS
ncbi:MAG TPA: hypothetical protein VG095_10410 [Chthoniobacterales bacterium]|nr:hypothetical protein [Chthoniobacterales bacterium]